MHTPGPWLYENNEDDDCESWAIVSESTDNRDIVAIISKTGDEDYDHRATWKNAELIAAAPDMLEALEAWIAHDGEVIYSGIGTEHDSAALESAKKAAIAAVAKARGE